MNASYIIGVGNAEIWQWYYVPTSVPLSDPESKKSVVPLFEDGLTEFDFDGSELTLQDPDKEVPASACRLQEAGVNALCLSFDEVKHRLDHPRRSENLSVVGDT